MSVQTVSSEAFLELLEQAGLKKEFECLYRSILDFNKRIKLESFGFFLEEYVIMGADLNIQGEREFTITGSTVSFEDALFTIQDQKYILSDPGPRTYFVDFTLQNGYVVNTVHPKFHYLPLWQVNTDSHGMIKDIVDMRGEMGFIRFRKEIQGIISDFLQIDTKNIVDGAVTAAKTGPDVAKTAQVNALQQLHDALRLEFDGHKDNTVIHVTQADKDKLYSIEPGAEVNQSAFSTVKAPGQPDVNAVSKTDHINMVGGTGIIVTTDPATNEVKFTATTEAVPGPHAETHITGGTDVIPNAQPGGKSGLMSGTDKDKLDSVDYAANHYVHPPTHPASMIVEDPTRRFVTDTDKSNWNAKPPISRKINAGNGLTGGGDLSVDRTLSVDFTKVETPTGAQTKANTAETNAINWAKSYGLGAYARNITGANLNNFIETGWYVGTNLTNSPNTAHYYLMEIICWDSVTCVQNLWRNTSAAVTEMYTRVRSNSTWTPWRLIYHDGNFDPDSKVSKSGAETITGSKTFTVLQKFNSEVHCSGNFPLHFIGGANDTPNKRNYRWDVVEDKLRLQTLDDNLAHVGTVMELKHDRSSFKLNGSEAWTSANNAASIGSSGYQKLASGLILQWGYATPPTPGEYQVTFPIAFPSNLRNVTISPQLMYDNYSVALSVWNTSKTGFTANFKYSGEQGGGRGFYWLAIGH